MAGSSRDELVNSKPVRLTDKNEVNVAKVTNNEDLRSADVLDNGGLDVVIPLTTTPAEGKVGGTRKTLRKYVIMEALSTNVKWGFSNTTQSFDLFKSQLIMLPVGENTEIWFVMSTGTGSVAFGEVS